jgi:hypothetical protein
MKLFTIYFPHNNLDIVLEKVNFKNEKAKAKEKNELRLIKKLK